RRFPKRTYPLLKPHFAEIKGRKVSPPGVVWGPCLGRRQGAPPPFRAFPGPRLQSLAQLLLDFRGKERLRGTRAGFSTPRRPHVNKDCRRSRTEGPKFFGNTFITGCSHLNGICACSYSFELYVAAQRCSLREDLPASGKQSNH